jgi:hypothetical protein
MKNYTYYCNLATHLGYEWTLKDDNEKLAATSFQEWLSDQFDNEEIVLKVRLWLKDFVDNFNYSAKPIFEGLLKIENDGEFMKFVSILIYDMW